MNRTVRVSLRAQRDVQQIYDMASREEPSRAGSFIDGLLGAIASLEQFAERGSIPRDEGLRRRGYRYLIHRKHLVFYKVLRRQVRVYRVLHGRRAYRDIV